VALLKIPFCPQDKSHGCGDGILDSMCKFWGVRRLKKRISNPLHGTPPETLDGALREHGFKTFFGNLWTDLLDAITRQGVPVLCPIQHTGVGHWIAVRGVTAKRVYWLCPIDGECSAPRGTWESVWTDETSLGREFVRFGIGVHLT
jgi:hypothetical protein